MKTVLVVDDNAVNVKLVTYVLEALDLEVTSARNAEETYAALEKSVPALVLMDVQLPGASGLDVTRKLRADPRFTSLPIVAITAYAMPSDKKDALDAGCNDFVTKPIDIRALSALVTRLIGENDEH